MAGSTLSPQRQDQNNPGQRHEDDLFKHFEDQYNNPTGVSTGEDANIDRANSSLRDDLNDAEKNPAAGGGSGKGSVANQETAPNYYKKPRVAKAKREAGEMLQESKGRSAAYKQRGGRRRGILIGFGAGGGLLSVVAGFSSLLPFKLPGIMDGIVGDAGKRVEQVVERRAERILITYMLKGSAAAVKNGKVIVTGNPIGDLFANIRTSNFERNLLANKGLAIEPSPDGTGVRLKYNGDYLKGDTDFSNGTLRNSNDIFKLLDEGKTLTRADIRAIVRTEVPAWRFWKRAKFVNWLRLKYNVPRYGNREQEPTEKDEDYEKSLKKEHIERVEAVNMQNLNDFVDCAAESGDCVDKTEQGEKIIEQTEKAVSESAEELAKEGVKKSSSTMVKLMISKLTGSAVGTAIPFVGWIDIAARVMHSVGEVISGDLLQKKHAQYVKASSAALAIAYAGYGDQTKAGDNKAEVVGMWADNFDGWEQSATYSIIQSSALNKPVTGDTLEPMERAQESVPTNEYISVVKTLFGTVGWIGRAPLELWYQTVSRLFDAVGDVAGDAIAWIMQFTPAAALLAQLAPLLNDILAAVLKFVGMFADPLEVGSRLALFVHQGFLGTFNDKAKEDGMRKLSEAQAVGVDQQIKQDRIADLQNKSLYDRVFNLDNTDSLATQLAITTPTSAIKDPVGSLSGASARLVANIPTNLAQVTTSSASAATAATMSSESLFGLNSYGGLETDLAAELDNSVSDTNKVCPENNDNSFNHCKIDRDVVSSVNCIFVKCADMTGENAQLQGDPLFAYGAEGPKYGPDAVESKPKYGAIALDWTKAGGLLAAVIPLGALEVSRRKLS